MKKPLNKFVSIFMALGLLIPYTPALAVDVSDFDANFLLSDAELQNWRSMTRADIQAFLNDQGGYISNYRTQDVNGEIRPVSDIIYRAAKEHRINPKYILVKLQKEQSLVTDRDPTQKQIDWATGYAVCDSCKTTDPAIQKNKGFGKQVDSAAGIMRWYYDNLNSQSWIKRSGRNYLIDGQNVRPATLATGFLYTYTPHIHGNRNFWILWQRWFEQVYPDGSLIKSASDSTVYLIKNGKKYPFTTFAALSTRFDPKLILTVPASELARYENGPALSIPNYAILKQGNNYYLLDNDTVRKFENFDVVRQLGYHPDEFIEIDASDLAPYTSGSVIRTANASPLGRLVRIKENNNLYYIFDGQYSLITDQQIAKTTLVHLVEENAQASELEKLAQGQPILFKDGTLIGIEGESKIYVIEKGKKRHIADESIFNGLGYNWDNILWTNQFTGLNHPTGQPIYSRPNSNVEDVSGILEEGSVNVVDQAPPAQSLADKMIHTPEAETEYIGKQIETEVNTYLIADQASGEILAGKNIDDVRPMASFAKVMTGYQLFKEGMNPNGGSVYSPTQHKALYHRFRIAPGEAILNKDLLDAMLVSSLNTPTQMLVDRVTRDDRNGFIESMNEQTKDWGLNKTEFVDVTGERLGNITTAREYLTLYQKATNNITLRQAMAKPSYKYTEVIDTDGKPDHFDTHSNDLVAIQSELPYSVITSKTGYLEESGSGLVMDIKRKTDGKRFVVIMMGNPDYHNRYTEFKRIAKWAVSNF